jgi:hypothetical protein
MQTSIMESRVLTAWLLLAMTTATLSGALPDLKVSHNQRFLVQTNGTPFFYLGDTAWELFHKLNREEALAYLKNRAELRFTVIQAVALAELDGLRTPNAYGHVPFENLDPLKPNEDYWRHVDYVVNQANDLGLYIAMLPTWGDKWKKAWGVGPEIFTESNAEAYGVCLGQRYRDASLIWVLGGDRAPESNHVAIIRAMARGLAKGDQGKHLMTYHPQGGLSSSKWFHDEPWLSFNMRQNGHDIVHTGRYEQTGLDYALNPVKPVLDGEPAYEDHPVAFDPHKQGYTVAADVRRAMYWDLFSGACGHTYGNHAVWQMYNSAKGGPVNNPLMPWWEAIHQPGASQMRHGRNLLESRPFLTRVPDDSLILPDAASTNAVPGAGMRRMVATRDEDYTYAMVYVPAGRAFGLRLESFAGSKLRAWWFNPRDGKVTSAGSFPRSSSRRFVPPTPGELLDWVLVVDDASLKYPAPGSKYWSGNAPGARSSVD